MYSPLEGRTAFERFLLRCHNDLAGESGATLSQLSVSNGIGRCTFQYVLSQKRMQWRGGGSGLTRRGRRCRPGVVYGRGANWERSNIRRLLYG